MREGFDGSVGLKGHKSEAYDLEAEHLVDNNGTYEELYEKIDEVLEDIL